MAGLWGDRYVPEMSSEAQRTEEVPSKRKGFVARVRDRMRLSREQEIAAAQRDRLDVPGRERLDTAPRWPNGMI